MSDNRSVFAQNLQYYMKKANMSRSEICLALGFKYSTFTDWVNGNKYPRIDKIEQLANFFGIEKSDLIEPKLVASQSLQSVNLSSHERALIIAYREADPVTRGNICTLLHIEVPEAQSKNA